MANTPKRRQITQLPAVLQTDTLKNFFGTTVDNLFQPGSSESISGYIGQKPSYYNPEKDFYLAEPTPERAAYQLEPAMVSTNTGGIMTDSLTYDDLVNYMRSQGAQVDNHNRMFEGDYYSWAPPVDLDKLNNYVQYVWMGSLDDDQQAATSVTIRAPREAFSFDANSFIGATTILFPLPPADAALEGRDENPVVLVNGEIVAHQYNADNATVVISTAGLDEADVIETIRYGDMKVAMDGEPEFDYSPYLAWSSTTTGIDLEGDYVLNLPRVYKKGELTFAEDAVYLCIQDHTASNYFTDASELLNWQLADNATFATTGQRVSLVDGIGLTPATARTFFVDGVGSEIELTNDYTQHSGGATPQYIVIDRRSREQSPWARRNLWVHKSSLEWSGVDLEARRAQRPIVEFLPNIELYNYGTTRLDDVQAVLSNSVADVIDAYDTAPFDDSVWDSEKIALSRVNGQIFERLGDTIVGSVVVDNGYILKPNDRLFVHQPISTEPALNHLVYRVVSNPDTELPSGATADVIELVLEGNPQRGDIIRVTNDSSSVFADPVEYWFNGVEWVVAQTGADVPLFMLYDASENQLSDVGAFPETNFAGNRLFGYKIGTGVDDPVLGFPTTLNNYAQPVFQIDSVTERVTYASGEVIGYYYHRIYSDDGSTSTFSNNWFPVATPSSQELVDGVYSIPLNLQANPENLEVEEISRNQWFDQFSTIMLSQEGFEGHPYSVNNWRDTAKVLGTGDKILQHRSPLLKTMLISTNSNYDLPAALRYAEQEYSRYRNKFVQTIVEFQRAGAQPSTVDGNGVVVALSPELWVSAAIDHLRVNKTADFPFAGSTMGGGQYFIPPTPAHMGLGLVAQPSTYVDDTYSTPVSMIVGHDATATPAFNDWRDAIMLAFEQRIYENIPQQFRTEARPLFDLDHYIVGAFGESTDFTYTMAEIDAMLSPYFQRWTQLNRFDYRINNGYVADAPFTWNYGSASDRVGDPVPGNWRGIYRKYFDTERPHTHPWEMLGFAEKPVWWQSEYGPAPYTRGNTKLWDDLRDGLIRDGARAGTDTRYARPDLWIVLPVDDEGRLLDPIAANIIIEAPTYSQATAPWKFGDVSPVESLWRQSSSFRFAQAQVGFLTKPPRFVEQGWDTINHIQDDTGQWIYAPTGNRPLNSDIFVHGELLADGSRMVAQGVQQWISDYMVARGQAPANFGGAIRGLAVRLAHKMAGFTTSDNLRILADNFGLIPSEDIDIQLYNSPSIREEVYSGVLIEWTGAGWRVVGYDTRTPSFKIINPLTTGPRGIITLATSPEPVVNTWRPNTYYTVNVNVAYQHTVYRCIKGHTSSSKFDQQYWQVFSALPTQAPRITTYQYGDGTISEIPYGTVFTDYQQVADFLLGYQRYLEAQGWEFNRVNPDTQESIDWSLATREFLAWAQVSWQPGNFITLSPGAEGLTFVSEHGMVLDVLDSISGVYGMIDRAGAPIHRENVVINRLEDTTILLSKNYDVYGARINLGEIEHVIIFSNTTIFNDIIYSPLFNLRQPRLRVIGRRSTDWTGRIEAPGYMIVDNKIVSNFEKAATDLLTMWDIEKADNATLRDHARHITGYDSRDYLASLVLSETEQFEFYQGMIHQKGAPGSFDKLLRSDFIEQSRDLKFFEEWAIKISEYGSLDSRQRTAFLFGQSTVRRDPQYIEFHVVDANSPVYIEDPDAIYLTDDTTTGIDSKWIERPNNPLTTFPQRSNREVLDTDFPAAGYVRLSEINQVVFSADDIPTAYDSEAGKTMKLGDTLWIHENNSQRDVSATSTTDWYVLGLPINSYSNVANANVGHWDATSNTITSVSSAHNLVVNNANVVIGQYVYTNADNERVFQSKKFDAPYVSDSTEFVPVVGETYKVTFEVRKTSRETNGIKAYVRPAFDAFKTVSVTNTTVQIVPALGTKEGFGYNKDADLIDTTDWVLNQWYTVTAEWTCSASSPQYFTARSRIRINRNYPGDTVTTPYSDALFEVKSQNLTLTGFPNWDVLKSYNLSATGNTNTIANIVTNAEDVDVSETVTRVYTTAAHGLTSMDRGLWVVIDGDTFSDPNLEGIQRLWDIGDGWFEILTTGELGYDFVAKGEDGPQVRILRSIHFTSLDQFNSFKERVGVKDDDIAYVDGNPWRVYKRTSITELTDDYADGSPQPAGQKFVEDDNNRRPLVYTFWNIARSQPTRMDAAKVASSLIYDLKTKITDTDLRPEPLSLDHLTVVAPLSGIIPGRAKAEIDYILDYDPAKYNTLAVGSIIGGNLVFGNDGAETGVWGPNQVGRVWWDLSTVRFLETETDDVTYGLTNRDRYGVETAYRVAHWGQIAPATSVDVYEWVRSELTPENYQARIDGDETGTFVGQVYNLESPAWVEAEELDPVTGKVTTFYYFWVKNLVNIPPNKGRRMSVASVARFIISPMIEDQPWISPVMPNGVLVGGINPFLDDTFEQDANSVAVSGTVLQIETNDLYDGVIHDEWFLLRPKDERSLPPQWLWEKLRDSLVGFTDNKVTQPAPLTLPRALPTVNKAPVWYESPDEDANPINPE